MKKYRGLNGDKNKWIYADSHDVLDKFQYNGVWKDSVETYNPVTKKYEKVKIDLYNEK